MAIIHSQLQWNNYFSRLFGCRFSLFFFLINFKIQLSFPSYALVSPNECDLNFIEIFGEKTDLGHRLRHFCGSKIDIVLSKTNILHLRLFAHHTVLRSTFDALFTAVTLYRETEGWKWIDQLTFVAVLCNSIFYTGNPKCISSEFDCEDAVCIDSSLRCNGRVNCKFRYDEDNCKVLSTYATASYILQFFSKRTFPCCWSGYPNQSHVFWPHYRYFDHLLPDAFRSLLQLFLQLHP